MYIDQKYTKTNSHSQAGYAPTRMCIIQGSLGFLIPRAKTRNAIPHLIPPFLQFTIIAHTHLPLVTSSSCIVTPFVPISMCHLIKNPRFSQKKTLSPISCPIHSCNHTNNENWHSMLIRAYKSNTAKVDKSIHWLAQPLYCPALRKSFPVKLGTT